MERQRLRLLSCKKASALFVRLLAGLVVFLVAYSFFDSHFPPLALFDLRALLLAAILLAAGIIDRIKGIVPMEITYPLMLAGVARAIILNDPSFLLYWFALAIIYLFNVVGGGDVKLLMGMFGLFPNLEFFVVMEVVILATHLPIVLYRRVLHGNLCAQLQFLHQWTHLQLLELVFGQVRPESLLRQVIVSRPSSETLSAHGDRLAIAFSFAGVLYLFLCTPAGLNWHIGI